MTLQISDLAVGPPMNGSHVATDRVTVAEQQEELVDWTTFAIEGVLLPVLAIFGILGKQLNMRGEPQKAYGKLSLVLYHILD